MQKISEKEAIEIHIAENIHRIEVIENFMYRVPDADKEKCGKNISVLSKINGLLQEIQQYRAIGTVEECREARKRIKPEQPNLHMNEVSGMFVDYADGHGEYKTQMNNWWRCPCCNSVVGQRVIVHGRKHDQHKKKFCKECGQAIDWEE